MLNKTIITPLLSAAIAWPMAYGHEGHEHEKEYFGEGHLDIALVFHEDEGELEFALFGDHDHEDEDHEEDEHAEEADEHSDEDEEHEHEEHEHDHGEGIELDEGVILAGANTEFSLPESGDFAFIGESGTIVYILPQDPTAGPVAPGFAMEFEDGIFTGDTATVSLTALEGPGELVAYQVDGFGDVTIIFDTRDGLDAADTYTGYGESHEHLNWAFTQPGIYHLELKGNAQLAADDSELTASGELMVQVGAGAAYLQEIEVYEDGWAVTENLGEVYAAGFPWLYMPLVKGWAFANGEGGDEMFLYVKALDAWTYTGAELAPWFYDFERASWIYLQRLQDDSVYVYSSAAGTWSPLP